MGSSRRVHAAVAMALVHALSGCASTGPDLRGPAGPGLMAAYSGQWVLVPEQSEDLNRKLEDSMRGPTGRPGGGMPGGRPGGGMPPGGMGDSRPGGGMRGGMPGGGIDPEEIRQSMEAIRKLSGVPSEVSLVLQPETVTFTLDGQGDLILEREVDLMGRAVKGKLLYRKSSNSS